MNLVNALMRSSSSMMMNQNTSSPPTKKSGTAPFSDYFGRCCTRADFERILDVWKGNCAREGIQLSKAAIAELKKRMKNAGTKREKAKLSFANCQLDDRKVKQLLETLALRPLISKLDLQENDISNETARVLLRLLKGQVNLVRKIPLTERLHATFLSEVNLSKSRSMIDETVLDEIRMYTEILNVANANAFIRSVFLAGKFMTPARPLEVEKLWTLIISKPECGAILSAYVEAELANKRVQSLQYDELECVLLQGLINHGAIASLNDWQQEKLLPIDAAREQEPVEEQKASATVGASDEKRSTAEPLAPAEAHADDASQETPPPAPEEIPDTEPAMEVNREMKLSSIDPLVGGTFSSADSALPLETRVIELGDLEEELSPHAEEPIKEDGTRDKSIAVQRSYSNDTYNSRGVFGSSADLKPKHPEEAPESDYIIVPPREQRQRRTVLKVVNAFRVDVDFSVLLDPEKYAHLLVLVLRNDGLHNFEKLKLHRRFTYLTDLDLAYNNISMTISILPQTLLRLDLSHNKISNVSGILNCIQLEELNLSHNQIRTFHALPSTLCRLDLSYNLISNVNTLRSLALSSNIQQLGLAGNPLVHHVANYKPLLRTILPMLTHLDNKVFAKPRTRPTEVLRSIPRGGQLDRQQEQRLRDEERSLIYKQREQWRTIQKEEEVHRFEQEHPSIHRTPLRKEEVDQLTKRLTAPRVSPKKQQVTPQQNAPPKRRFTSPGRRKLKKESPKDNSDVANEDDSPFMEFPIKFDGIDSFADIPTSQTQRGRSSSPQRRNNGATLDPSSKLARTSASPVRGLKRTLSRDMVNLPVWVCKARHELSKSVLLIERAIVLAYRSNISPEDARDFSNALNRIDFFASRDIPVRIENAINRLDITDPLMKKIDTVRSHMDRIVILMHQVESAVLLSSKGNFKLTDSLKRLMNGTGRFASIVDILKLYGFDYENCPLFQKKRGSDVGGVVSRRKGHASSTAASKSDEDFDYHIKEHDGKQPAKHIGADRVERAANAVEQEAAMNRMRDRLTANALQPEASHSADAMEEKGSSALLAIAAEDIDEVDPIKDQEHPTVSSVAPTDDNVVNDATEPTCIDPNKSSPSEQNEDTASRRWNDLQNHDDAVDPKEHDGAMPVVNAAPEVEKPVEKKLSAKESFLARLRGKKANTETAAPPPAPESESSQIDDVDAEKINNPQPSQSNAHSPSTAIADKSRSSALVDYDNVYDMSSTLRFDENSELHVAKESPSHTKEQTKTEESSEAGGKRESTRIDFSSVYEDKKSDVNFDENEIYRNMSEDVTTAGTEQNGSSRFSRGNRMDSFQQKLNMFGPSVKMKQSWRGRSASGVGSASPRKEGSSPVSPSAPLRKTLNGATDSSKEVLRNDESDPGSQKKNDTIDAVTPSELPPVSTVIPDTITQVSEGPSVDADADIGVKVIDTSSSTSATPATANDADRKGGDAVSTPTRIDITNTTNNDSPAIATPSGGKLSAKERLKARIASKKSMQSMKDDVV